MLSTVGALEINVYWNESHEELPQAMGVFSDLAVNQSPSKRCLRHFGESDGTL